jgi:hypothetical protein
MSEVSSSTNVKAKDTKWLSFEKRILEKQIKTMMKIISVTNVTPKYLDILAAT